MSQKEALVVLTYEKQALSGTIEVLLRSELPDEFEGTKLYGSLEEDELRQDCKIFRLSNETGHGRITVYQVFSGIELYYNDMHMGYCNQNQATAKNMIEINHCLIGRFECSFGENSCCYMAEGDLSISSMMKKKSNSCFPLNHYHGISIVINLDELLPEIRQIMELLNIDLHYIQKYICEGNRCCIMRANPSIEHIFSELYRVEPRMIAYYLKVKVLELLMFLNQVSLQDYQEERRYFARNQVQTIKKMQEYMTADLRNHYTLQELSEKFEIPLTSMKVCFKGVYGCSIYAYMKSYRMQAATILLRDTSDSITEIAAKMGYDNPSNFSEVFKKEFGELPSEFRKKLSK